MVAAKPFPIDGNAIPSDSNPHSWLTLVGDAPNTAGPRCMTGTLRPEHRGRTNSAAAFAAAKLLCDGNDTHAPWMPKAYRSEVLLPHDTDDRFTCPKQLFAAVDAAHPPGGKALLGYVTLTWTPNRLHQAWALARQLVAELVQEHSVPALMLQHVPSLVASTAQPHVHVLFAGPRKLSQLGWGGYVGALIGDRVWSMVRDRFHALLAAAS